MVSVIDTVVFGLTIRIFVICHGSQDEAKRNPGYTANRESDKGQAALQLFLSTLLGLILGTAPAWAEVEQCRFIQAKPEREACYQRQEKELAAKRKPEPTVDTSTIESLQQQRRDDDALYKSMRGICRGC